MRATSSSNRGSFGYTCVSMNFCSRRRNSFVFSLGSKFMVRTELFACENWRAFLNEVRHAFLEVCALQAGQHFSLGGFESFRQSLEHRLVYLPLHHAQRSRANVRSQVRRIFQT